MTNRKIFTTSDGSHSIYDKNGVAYHSIYGALQESKHVFIDMGLNFVHQQHLSQVINIFELGFGTGLNALLTAQFAKETKRSIHYETIEPFLLQEIEFQRLNYGSLLNDEALFIKLHQCSCNTHHQLLSNFNFVKYNISIEDFKTAQLFHLIYFDAFAPTAQPQLWEAAILKQMFSLLQQGGVMVTYCSKGIVKRALKQIGFMVQALPGALHKREMIRAIKL